MRDEMRLLERVQHDLREVRWAAPAELRERAARRRRHAMAGAAIAVLMVAALSAVVTKRLAAPPPPPLAAPLAVPTVAVPSAEIPREALVQPGDLSVSTEPPLGRTGLGEPVQIDQMLLSCHREQGRAADWEMSRYSRSQTLLRSRVDGTEPGLAELLFSQDVYRLTPQVADRIVARIDALLTPCASWLARGEALWEGDIAAMEAEHRWEVTDRDFVGDQALMIEHSVTAVRNLETGESRRQDHLERTAVVRVGDLITVMGLGRDGTARELRRLAAVAAERLCTAANPPC
ncbi:hypothetical protein [Micromonospora lutea]|uniref:Uncharacterized protein n=1 Tax=Micromonospora lutea TaxID=419825 RepID=A0ABQ4INS9_9ACTN|nr:hypothetical protein [Micromonospora lutea]GIJ19577.1 hypothetical protein Vlu01_02010 [Micromonospora lutea]